VLSKASDDKPMIMCIFGLKGRYFAARKISYLCISNLKNFIPGRKSPAPSSPKIRQKAYPIYP